MSIVEPQTRSQIFPLQNHLRLVVKFMALVILVFGLLAAFGMFVTQLVGDSNPGSLAGYFVYCVVSGLLARDIYKAQPARNEPVGGNAEAPDFSTFRFAVLGLLVTFLMALTLPALTFGEFDSGFLAFYVMTSVLAWVVFRVQSMIWAFVALVLAGLVFLVLTAGMLHSSYEGEPKGDGPAGAALAELVGGLRKEHKLVGLAALVTVDGKLVATAADGERKIHSGVPIELDDEWHIGSITKSVTATMIARLVESGQLKWTDTVGDRFSEASIHEDWKLVTLQQLLTHTSGAPANFSLAVRLKTPAIGPECTRERRQAVIEVMTKKPEQPPGEKFAYSNVGYTIAGAMAEGVTGVSWEDLVKREVFEPLELQGAGFGPPKSPAETLDQPRGHRGQFGWKTSANDADDNTPIMGPAGTVHMTLADLCTFATEHLRGELGNGKLLSAETYKKLHTPQLQSYACGWVMKPSSEELPHTVYWHNGSNTMWYALVVFIPEKNMVVAATSNDGDIRAAESAAWKIVNASANQFGAEADSTSLPVGD